MTTKNTAEPTRDNRVPDTNGRRKRTPGANTTTTIPRVSRETQIEVSKRFTQSLLGVTNIEPATDLAKVVNARVERHKQKTHPTSGNAWRKYFITLMGKHRAELAEAVVAFCSNGASISKSAQQLRWESVQVRDLIDYHIVSDSGLSRAIEGVRRHPPTRDEVRRIIKRYKPAEIPEEAGLPYSIYLAGGFSKTVAKRLAQADYASQAALAALDADSKEFVQSLGSSWDLLQGMQQPDIDEPKADETDSKAKPPKPRDPNERDLFPDNDPSPTVVVSDEPEHVHDPREKWNRELKSHCERVFKFVEFLEAATPEDLQRDEVQSLLMKIETTLQVTFSNKLRNERF